MKIIKLLDGYQAKVSDIDYKNLSQFRWTSNGKYAWRSLNGKRVWMHRVILERMGHNMLGMEGDHINFDKLDNRRSNLQSLTTEENKSRVNPGMGAKVSIARKREWASRSKEEKAKIIRKGHQTRKERTLE